MRRTDPNGIKKRRFLTEDGALIPNATGRARPTHSSFRRVSAVLTAVLLTCIPEAPWVSTPVSCLLTDCSAMAGFRPDSFRCFGTVSCAQLRSSGFPFLLRRCLQKHAPATVHRMAYSEIFTAKSTSCGFHGYYTRYIRSLQAIPRLYARFFTFRRRRKIPVRSLLYSDAPG